MCSTASVRFHVATSIGLPLLLLSAVHAACLPQGEQCSDSNASVSTCQPTFDLGAHVPGTAASLVGATVTFCRNGDCATVTFPAPPTGPVAGTPTFALGGAGFSAQAQLDDEGDGFTVVDISLDASALTLTDGDTYSVTVANGGGQTLLDVSRPVTYDVVQGCDGPCREYSMQVYPTSASGIACGDTACASGISFLGTLTSPEPSAPIDISLCRNGACVTGVGGLGVGFSDGVSGELTGAFTVQWAVQLLKNDTSDFQLSVQDDAAALADGDTYALTITQGGTTLASWSGPAPYQTSFPNGMQCDVFACRNATITVQ